MLYCDFYKKKIFFKFLEFFDIGFREQIDSGNMMPNANFPQEGKIYLYNLGGRIENNGMGSVSLTENRFILASSKDRSRNIRYHKINR